MIQHRRTSKHIGFALLLLGTMALSGTLQAQKSGQNSRPPVRWMQNQNLTNDQRNELHQMIQTMRENEDTREEIGKAVVEKLNSWGIETPEGRNNHRPFRSGRLGQHPDLTEEQREAIRAKREEMREAGTSHEQIRQAIGDMLREFGVKPRGPHAQLTEGQRIELRDKIEAMHQANAMPEEIHQAVCDLFETWGIELPNDADRPPLFGRGKDHVFALLTEEQRIELKDKIQALRDSGASRKEIHDTIRDQLVAWGIERPERQGRHMPSDKSRQIGVSDERRARVFPNPFNPSTSIAFTLENAQQISLNIYNIQGQLIRSLAEGPQSAGTHTIRWNGCDQTGQSAPAGIYIWRLEAGYESASGRLTLMK